LASNLKDENTQNAAKVASTAILSDADVATITSALTNEVRSATGEATTTVDRMDATTQVHGQMQNAVVSLVFTEKEYI
jgi:hypothetical protein